MKTAALAALTLSLMVLASSGADDAPVAVKKIHCPVVGLPECRTCRCSSGYCSLQPHEEIAVAFAGGKLRFCCAKCKDAFVKTPATFTANAHHQLVATGQARQTKCPLCGGAPQSAHALDIGGVTVQFATAACRAKAAAAAPAERVALVFGAEGFARGFGMQN